MLRQRRTIPTSCLWRHPQPKQFLRVCFSRRLRLQMPLQGHFWRHLPFPQACLWRHPQQRLTRRASSLSPDAAFLLSSRLLALSFTLLEVFSVSDPADRNAELTASQASLKFSLIFITLFMSIGASLNFPNNSEKDRITPSSKAIPSIAEPIRCSESMTSRALFSMSPSCLDALANMASMAFSNRFFTSSGVIACATSPSSSIVCTCPFFQPPFRRRSYAGALPNDHHLTVSVTRPAFSLPATKRQDKLIEWTRKAIDQ